MGVNNQSQETLMLNRILNSKLLFIFIVCFLTFGYFKKADRYFGLVQYHNHEAYPIVSDGSGYYAFLPQWFIYKTDNFEFIDSIQKKYPDARFNDGISYNFETNENFNKYFIGTPILQAPGFLITHYLATIFHLDNDGYSTIYQIYTVLIAFIFVFLGFWCIAKILSYYRVSRFTKLVTLLAIGFGTNIGAFIIYNPTFSHAFSFAVISFFILSLYRWREANNPIKHIPLLAFLVGFIFILRPTDGIVALLIPFFFKNKKSILLFIRNIFTTKASFYLLIGVSLFILPIFLQVLSTHQQQGIWSLNSYVNERFDYFTNPKIIEVLFGFRKGLFIYSPILLISLFGFYTLWKKDKFIAIGSILLLIIFTYITASWWCWWYGGGLGMRPYINIFVLFAIPFGLLFEAISNRLKIVILVCSAVFVYMYQIYQYQMVNNILHYDNMNYAQFKQVFMQTDKRFEWSLHMDFDTLPHEKAAEIVSEKLQNTGVIRYNMDQPDQTLKVDIVLDSTYKHWAGSVVGKVKIVDGKQNPNFTVRYFKNDSLVKEREYIFGGKIPKINVYHPIQINFNPDFPISSFDKVEIAFFAAGYECYFKEAKFTSYYYLK